MYSYEEKSGTVPLSSANRPLGVTLLAVLHVIQAVIFVLIGFVVVAVGGFISRRMLVVPHLLRGILWIIGAVLIIVGLLYLVLAYGLWSGKGWAWWISLILAGLGVILSILSLLRGGVVAVITLLLDLLIIYYLLKPNVKAFFGESGPQPITSIGQSGQPPQPTQSTAPAIGSAKFCSTCGAPLTMDEKFCAHCGTRIP